MFALVLIPADLRAGLQGPGGRHRCSAELPGHGAKPLAHRGCGAPAGAAGEGTAAALAVQAQRGLGSQGAAVEDGAREGVHPGKGKLPRALTSAHEFIMARAAKGRQGCLHGKGSLTKSCFCALLLSQSGAAGFSQQCLRPMGSADA